MRILGVYMENIRSYKRGLIVFPPKGITVIHGEIGAGKTSILMAIRFALFGIAPGGQKSASLFDAYKEPHGADLLRVDSTRGRVRLLILVGNKLYVIERYIERLGQRYDATQGAVEEYAVADSGIKFITRRAFTSRKEMDDYVLSILGIREKKSERGVSTPLVFTTAIYVPQFNVHEVLQLDVEKRVEIIERALGLDKYKLFKLNQAKVTDALKDKKRLVEAKIDGYRKLLGDRDKDKLLKEKERLIGELKKIEVDKKAVEEEFHKLKDLEEKFLNEIKNTELRKQEVTRILRDYDEKRSKLLDVEYRIRKVIESLGFMNLDFETASRSVNDRISSLESRKAKIDSELLGLEKQEIEVDRAVEESRKRINDLEKELLNIEKDIEAEQKLVRDLENELKNTEELLRRGICPTCRREIPREHGLRLVMEATERIEERVSRVNVLKGSRRKIEEAIALEKKRLGELEAQKLKISDAKKGLVAEREAINKELLKLFEVKARLEELMQQRQLLISELAGIDIAGLTEELKKIDLNIEELRAKVEEVKKAISEVLKTKERILREIGKMEELIKSLEKQLLEVEWLNEELNRAQKERAVLQKLCSYLESANIVVDEIEKRVLKILVDEFRHYFYNYLYALVPDQPVEVVITDDFGLVPKIKIGRSSYSVPSPSGGQNISVSLAYRLALNQAVRRFSPSLKKSVLVLDEPTTGFSRGLVSRLKELLRSVGGVDGQVIIVTHDETLIEAGDCRIRLSLEPVEHKTSIEYEECTFSPDYRELVERILTLGSSGLAEVMEEKAIKGFTPRVEPAERTGVKFDQTKG